MKNANEAGKEKGAEKPNENLCGFGKWAPKCLQIFSGPKSFTFVVCIISCAQGKLNSSKGSVFSPCSTISKPFVLIESGSLDEVKSSCLKDDVRLAFWCTIKIFMGRG